MPDLTGQDIGRYHILEPLGEGGMAIVYKAYDNRLERYVAFKVIRTDLYGPGMLEQVLKRFDREAKALARLTHPNIVRIHDYGEYQDTPYLVMEYLPGGTLKTRAGEPTPYQEVARLLLPVAHALAYAHKQGILHRDVKPSNIMVTETGEPMLTDFGIAKILSTEESTALTGSGVGIGTPEYMAPEQGMGTTVDVRTDVYALGVVLYELVTGQKPYHADTPMAVIVKHITEPLPRPRDFVPDLPPEVEEILFKALAKSPDERYENVDAFAVALEKLISGRLKENIPTEQSASPIDRGASVPGGPTSLNSAAAQAASSAPGLSAQPVPQPSPTSGADAQVKIAFQTTPTPAEGDARHATATGHRKIGCLARFLFPLFLVGTLCLLVVILLRVGTKFTQIPGLDITQAAQTRDALLAFEPTLTPRSEIYQNPSPTLLPDLPTATKGEQTIFETLFEATPSPTSGSVVTTISPNDNMTQVYVPAGSFIMGAARQDNQSRNDEKPNRIVYLDAYWIDRTEVTAKMYALCVSAGVCQKPESRGAEPYYYDLADRQDLPVVYVSWQEAHTYCEWAGRRLPTEAEWEKAARGSDERIYPWGNTVTCTQANYWGTVQGCVGDLTAVGSYPEGASPYNVLDMAGNVQEWVADWYDELYYKKAPEANPAGPTTGTLRVARGGAWNVGYSSIRATRREGLDPKSWYSNLGYRCARSADK